MYIILDNFEALVSLFILYSASEGDDCYNARGQQVKRL